MYYVIKFRRNGQWFWRKKKCKWQSYNGQTDRLILCLRDGTYYEVSKVSEVDVKYGQDSIDVNKKLSEENKKKAEAEKNKQGT